MSSKQQLMQPLRSDHLKPRPSTEASYPQARSVQMMETPAVVEEMPFEKEIPALFDEAEAAPHDVPEKNDLAASVARLLAGETLVKEETQPEEPVFDLFTDAADDFWNEPPAEEKKEPPVRDGSIEAAIAAILSSSEDDDETDDEDDPVIHDAVPDHFLPEPACVPLFEDPAPKRSKRGWLWLLVPVIGAAAAGAAYLVF